MLADSEIKPRWLSPERDYEKEQRLCEELGIPSLVCASLVARGLFDPDAADGFLNPRLDDLHDPMLLPDAQEAVNLIMAAKERGETVYVHGDYDVDGVTSTAIWTRSLRKLGFNVIPHVPHRMKEGYGIHEIAVKAAAESGAKLFLTCDCGTSAVDTVAMAKELGMRVVVTDHHELGSALPDACALVNPHRPDSEYPFADLCGAAVAFKIAQAVSEECGAKRDQFLRAYLDLVCLGTIADVVPLVGENRILASHGLERLADTKKKGILALMSVADVTPSKVSASDVGWRLGPRINASGRVDDAAHSLELLLTDDEAEAAEIAERLDGHNRSRQAEEKIILEHALETIMEDELDKEPLILVAGPGWHAGVIGIVASRIVDRFYRPALVVSIDEDTGMARGSARSIAPFHLNDALQANIDVFNSAGGHAMAAGFSIDSDRLQEARERLVAYAGSVLSDEDLVPTCVADAEVSLSELNKNSIEELERLSPFGAANPCPRFIARRAPLAAILPTRNPEHVRFALDCPPRIYGIGFSMGAHFEDLVEGDEVDLYFEATMEEYNGYRNPKLFLRGLTRSV